MSYLVFARKWRPQKFDELVGQENITQALKNSVQSQKLAHAYLFVGPRGVGKTSCARILAKSLNCKDAPTINPCGKCSACIEISEGRSLDVIEIDGASNRGIDEIRTLRENVKFSPTQGKYKIYIIDEVHMLTQEAFNALLKTLEEPPEHVKFIFATTVPTKILPTILSRCQRFEFSRIPTLKIISKLEEICEAEKISVDKEALFDIAKISDGSMRDAESILDQLVVFSKEKITSKDVIAVMGLIEQDSYFDFTNAIKNKDAQFCIDFLSKLSTRGKNMANFIDGLLWHIRNLMLSKIMKSTHSTSSGSTLSGAKAPSNVSNLEELLDLPDSVTNKIIEQAKNLSLKEIVDMFQAAVNSQDMAKKIGSFRIPLELMIVKLTHNEINEKPPVKEALPDSQIKNFSNKIKSNIGSLFSGAKKDLNKVKMQPTLNKDRPDITIQKNLDSQDKKPEVGLSHSGEQDSIADTKPEAKSVDFNSLVNGWPQLVESISVAKMSVGTYLRESKPIKLEGEVLTIGFPKRSIFYKEAVEQRQNQNIIRDRINELFNTMLSLKFELVDEIIEHIDIQESQETEDKILKSALNTFKGRLFEKG